MDILSWLNILVYNLVDFRCTSANMSKLHCRRYLCIDCKAHRGMGGKDLEVVSQVELWKNKIHKYQLLSIDWKKNTLLFKDFQLTSFWNATAWWEGISFVTCELPYKNQTFTLAYFVLSLKRQIYLNYVPLMHWQVGIWLNTEHSASMTIKSSNYSIFYYKINHAL